MNKLIISLLLIATASSAQQKAFSTYTFSFGYGFLDLERESAKRNIENSYSVQEGYIYNRKQNLTGPLYLKQKRIFLRMWD